MSNSFLKILVIFVIVILISLLYNVNKPYNKEIIEESEYKYDVEPVNARFINIDEIIGAYWKSGTINKCRIFNLGPTFIWWRGYILISDKEGKMILEKYDWIEVADFDNTGNPIYGIKGEHGENVSFDITGLNSSKWLYSTKFNIDNLPERFIGTIYFDEKNNIIYFDLESN